MERLDTVGFRGQVGRFRPEQIAQASTWAMVPNGETTEFAMHSIRQVPTNSSTETIINPMDPGSDFYRFHDAGSDGTFLPAGRRL